MQPDRQKDYPKHYPSNKREKRNFKPDERERKKKKNNPLILHASAARQPSQPASQTGRQPSDPNKNLFILNRLPPVHHTASGRPRRQQKIINRDVLMATPPAGPLCSRRKKAFVFFSVLFFFFLTWYFIVSSFVCAL